MEIGGEGIKAIIDTALTRMVDSYGIEAACNKPEDALTKLYKEVVSDTNMVSYGTYPGIRTLVGSRYYPTARKLIFQEPAKNTGGLLRKSTATTGRFAKAMRRSLRVQPRQALRLR